MRPEFTFFEITPDSWDDAKEIGTHLRQCVFRGHEDNTWRLSTTIERAANQFGFSRSRLWQIEKLIIKEFWSRAHHYISAPPKYSEYIEWVSIIQHYGGPTRFLDFTESFYIASFFAVETAKQDACVWGVNFLAPLTKAMEKGYYTMQQESLLARHTDLEKLVGSYIKNEKKDTDFVIRIEPSRKNERLAIQQGTFLFPFNITKTFEQNLCKTFEFSFDSLVHENATEINKKELQKLPSASVGVIKINLPNRWHRNMMHDLNPMNINSASLFPGLDGFARSLRFLLRSWWGQIPGESLDK